MSEVFSPDQTRYILENIGVDVVSDTGTHWLCLCPFHHNTSSPAMVVDKEEGVYFCNNAACDERGPIRRMIQQLTGKSVFQTELLIYKSSQGTSFDTLDFVQRQIEPESFPDYPMELIDKAERNFWDNQDAIDYMTNERHFEERTLREFRVGYVHLPVSPKRAVEKHLIAVPMFDKDGKPVGYIGRGLYDKTFHNSYNLPKRHTLFNIHNSKRTDTTIVTEASFDTMRAWQATGIHGVATLGSYIGPGQAVQINRYFNNVILAPDDDKKLEYKARCAKCRKRGQDVCVGHNTGFELGLEIVDHLDTARVSWAHMDSLKRYDGHKDFGDITDEDIRYAVKHAVSNYEIVRRM